MISLKRLKSTLNVARFYQISKRNHHPYKFPDHKPKDLAEKLVKNLIYYDNGIVVFNKPHGVSFAQNSKANDAGCPLDVLCPLLKKSLKCNELFTAKVPERYASGLSVFCTNVTTLKRVSKCLRSMRGTKDSTEFYECIVIGQPNVKCGQFEGGITAETSPNGKQHGIKFIKECSSNKVRKGEIKNVKLHHWTLSSNDNASRLIISTTRTKFHSVRVYAAKEIVSPILGDYIFGKVVKRVLGKPVVIDMFNPAAYHQQKLPNDLLSKLELSSRNDIDIPLHLHLSRIHLKNVLGQNKDLEFIAKPPEYFLWTCEVLNLNIDSKVAALN